jgi:hypothetical protein
MVSGERNDVVFAICVRNGRGVEGCRVGDAMEVSTFNTHPRDNRSVQDAGWRAGAPAEQPRTSPASGRNGWSLQKIRRTTFRVHVK